MLSDIEIANAAKPDKISNVAKNLGLSEDEIELYGHYKARLNIKPRSRASKLILVTATNPTPFGEGKTTTSIGLADALKRLGRGRRIFAAGADG